jgi:succinate dehydrogenase/fumarate reductase-like Fe-S protein
LFSSSFVGRREEDDDYAAAAAALEEEEEEEDCEAFVYCNHTCPNWIKAL